MAARAVCLCAAAVLLLAVPFAARAQQIDFSHGGPITVTATNSIDLDQKAQTVTAIGDARAVRGDVTVTADRLIAYYRKKQPAPGSPAASNPAATKPATPVVATQPAPGAPGIAAAPDTGDNEIYRLVAEGHVHIYTQTDTAVSDRAVYDIDKAVLVLTGRNLRLTTPNDVMTARDSIEWWSEKHMGVGRGDASVTSKDGRRITADVLVAYTTSATPPPSGAAPVKSAAATPPGGDPLAASGKLKQAQAFGHVVIHTQTDIVHGDRGVYDPATGIAVLVGHVRITRGENQLNGNEAVVDLKTGLSRLVSNPGERVHGLVMPNSAQQQPGTTPAPAKR